MHGDGGLVRNQGPHAAKAAADADAPEADGLSLKNHLGRFNKMFGIRLCLF